MAEAVGLAASIAGLVQLTGAVFKLVTKFCKEAKDAPAKVQDLATQTRELAGVLENLRLLASSLETRDSNCSLKMQHLDACAQTLGTISSKLEKAQADFDSGKAVRTFSRRLKWPFSLSDTKDLAADLASHRATLHLALSADSMEALLKSLEKQDVLHNMIERKLSFDTRVQLNKRRTEIINFFLRVNPQAYLDISRELRHEATGSWLTSSDATFAKWKDDSNSKLWLSGIPGSGKTVLCGLVIETVLQDSDESTAVSYAFCDYKNPDTYLPENIIATLAVQLGQQSEDAFDLLEEYFDILHSENQLPMQPNLDDLLDLIQGMADVYDKVFVVVDGLDECGDHVSRMTRSLKSIANRSKAISTAFFSRKEEDIREELEDEFEHIEVEAHTKDLEDYTLAEVNKRKVLKRLEVKNPALYKDILVTLVKDARGMFRWVACQIDHICDQPNNNARRMALRELPPTLFGTYDRVLQKLRQSPPGMQTYIRKALHWIALGDPQIKIPALCEAVSIQDGIDKINEDDFIDEAEISRRCGCLLRKSLDGDYFEFAHFTVLEYLRSTNSESSVGEFRYSEQDAFRSLAETAMRFLLFPCFDRKPTLSRATERTYCMERNQRHPFYPHAAEIPKCLMSFNSRDLLRSQLFEEEPVFSWIKRLFSGDKSGYFMSWAQTASSHDDTIFDEFRTPNTSPLHLAASFAMPELCRFLLQQGANVNLSNSGSPLLAVISPKLAIQQGHAPQQSRVSSSPGAGRWAQTLSVLLDYGADASSLYEGQSDLSRAFDSLNGSEILPFVRASTAVPEDAIKAFSSRNHDNDADGQLLQAILELSTGVDAPPQWQPMAAPALILSRRRGLTVPDHTANLLLDRYSDEDYRKALEVTTRLGLAEELSALIADPRFSVDGCRLLHVAAESTSPGSGQIAGILLDSGIDINTVDSEGQTCLHASCESGNVEVAQVLLARGADVSRADARSRTAWHIAASNGHTEVLDMLLQQDRDVLQGLATSSADGRTPLFSAISAGYVEASLLLLERCPAESRFFKSRDPPLHDAVGTGSQELFSALLDKGVDLQTAGLGSTPLHHLGASCTAEFVRYLGMMYDPLCLDAWHKPPFERFLRRWICHNGEVDEDKTVALNDELLQLLLPASLEFSLNSTPPRTVHAWEIICEVIGPEDLCCFATNESDSDSDSTDTVQCEDFFSRYFHTIINHGVLLSYEDTRKKPSVAPLITALLKRQGGHFCSSPIASLIAEVMKCSTLQPSLNDIDGGRELLKKAISKDASTLVSTLIQYGADVHRREPKDYWGELSESPFEAACSEAEIATFEAVLAAAPLSRLNDTGPAGDTPIDLVVKGSSPDKTLMIRALYDKGADPKSGNREEAAILHAAKEGEWNVVKCLASLGADVFAKEKGDGWGLAQYAISDGKLDMLKWLVESASDPSQWQITCMVHTHSHKDAAQKQTLVDDRESLLHLAADKQQEMKYLLQQGIFTDVNILTSCKRTPLHYAAFLGSSSCCQILLDHGAVFTGRDKSGKLPIEYALDGSYTDIVTLLLKAGSPLPQTQARGVGDIIWSLSANEGLDIARNHYFEKAIHAGNLEQCKTAVSQGCSLDNPLPSCRRCTPLFAAIRARRENIVQWLLEQGASPLGVFCHHNVYPEVTQHAVFNLPSSMCMVKVLSVALRHGICWHPALTSPIHLAAKRDKVDVLQVIISHIEQNTPRYHHFFKPHLEESLRGNSDYALISALINQPEISDDGEFWDTPLHHAASVGNLDALNLLIRNGADVDAIDKNQHTPLIVASLNDQLDAVRELLANGAAIECRDFEGDTAMASAVKKGHLGIVQLLDLKSGFSRHFMNLIGENLTSLARLGDSPVETFKYLISRGVDPQQHDRAGSCALSLALNHSKLRDYVIQSRLVVALRPAPNVCKPDNPLAQAAAKNAIKSLKRIYLSLPRVEAQLLLKRDGWSHGSPLCEAAVRNYTRVAELLLDLQANIEQDGSSFGTPLMCAIVCGKLEMVKLLTRRGANLEYTDENGTYRSGLLASLQHPKVTKWLLVGRYQDQNKLTNAASNDEATCIPWSGKRAVKVVLKSWQQHRWGESTVDFCIRLEQIKREFVGQRAVGELV
ncbi:ankyrin repeat-containing domain protein [Ilyonectria destructans]|nr:ankyrin repeat-containing domain protein [Ilyonectria destructans]